jgi:hypothetical protein
LNRKVACLPKKNKTKAAALFDDSSNAEALQPKENPDIPAPKLVGPEDPSWKTLRRGRKWQHLQLYKSVYETMFALPSYFKSELKITGVVATDLYTFNTALGATIESQIVERLNELREVWDPENNYRAYRFVRQAQRFPDVILRSSTPTTTDNILLGIELKGWYALAKEREPSFRFLASPNTCAPWDILAVYPWALSEVISGTPQLFTPFVTNARWAAEYRNWYWQYGRESSSNKTINFSKSKDLYPPSKSSMNDVAVKDKGNNFGRLGRYPIMKEEYLPQLRREKVSGIPIDAWQRFLKFFKEDRPEESVASGLRRLFSDVSPSSLSLSAQDIASLREHLTELISILERARRS